MQAITVTQAFLTEYNVLTLEEDLGVWLTKNCLCYDKFSNTDKQGRSGKTLREDFMRNALRS